MKKMKRINMLLLWLLWSVCSIAQQFGEASFMTLSAPPLRMTRVLAEGLKSTKYLHAVGGVAFDKAAIPADTLHISSMQFGYDVGRVDGQRFSVVINGKQAFLPAYDWELIPIAHYADSSNYACFTLFGHLSNKAQEDTILNEGGRILNYNPAFDNTLLGLRLFQLDALTIYPTLTVDLPKYDAGQSKDTGYILGKGEQTPDTSANKKAYNKYDSVFESMYTLYDSYVLCDTTRTIEFGVAGDTLTISGEPFVYFFKYNTSEDFVKDKIYDSVDHQALAVQSKGKTKLEKHQLLEQWLLKSIHREWKKLDSAGYQLAYEKFLQREKDYKDLYGMDETIVLRRMLYRFKLANYPQFPIYLDRLSTALSNTPGLFRNINPAVWDAGVTTMRLSAFFRYCKLHYPDQWSAFLQAIQQVRVTPEVTTPTVFFPSGRSKY